MFNIIENVVKQGNFELKDILKKIDTFWLKGNLTDSEKDSLITLAQNKADVKYSIDVVAKFAELEMRIREIEEKLNGSEDNTEEGTDEGKYPEYEVGKWYYKGNKISFEGAKYVCVAPEGMACVWSPKEHPAYWEVVTE